MNKVFVGSLSWNTGDQELQDLFSQVGAVEEVKVITDRETGRSRGFGFVTFSNSEDANSAVSKFDGTELDGRNLKVNIAEDKPRREGGGGSGGYGGGRQNNRW